MFEGVLARTVLDLLVGYSFESWKDEKEGVGGWYPRKVDEVK